MGGLPRAPLREPHDQIVAVGLRRRGAIDAAYARRRHRRGECTQEPGGGSQEEVSRHAVVYSGAWARWLAHGIPCSVCADRAALPGLRRERLYLLAGRRSEPLAGPEGRSDQVRWCHLHPHLLELSGPSTVGDLGRVTVIPLYSAPRNSSRAPRNSSRPSSGAHRAPRSLGSRTSRSASPSMLNPNTASEIATPGQIAIQGARNM